MNRWFGLLAVAALVAALSVSTGGFSSVSADRPVSVAVVNDQQAYLGITKADAATSGQGRQLFTVQNQFSVPVTVSVSGPDVSHVSRALDPGRSVAVQGSLSCTSQTTKTVTATVHAQGTGVSVEKDLSFDVNCSPPIVDVSFTGKAKVDVTASAYPITVHVYGKDCSQIDEQTIDRATELSYKGNNGQITGVSVEENGKQYRNEHGHSCTG